MTMPSRSNSTITQFWPCVGGVIVLNVLQDKPRPEAIALLAPVIAAIEDYQATLAARLVEVTDDPR